MRRGSRLSVATATIATGAALVAGGATAQDAKAPDFRSMFLKASGQSVQATLGAYCHPGDTTPANCTAGPKYPLKTTGTLRLRRGTTVTLLFRANAGDIGWRAARIDGRGEEVITATGKAKLVSSGSKRRWKLTIPKSLARSTDLLGFDVLYPNSYSSFEVGLKVR